MYDLGTLGGTQSQASGINDFGHVAGYCVTASGSAHAFLWTPSQMRDLGLLTNKSHYSTGYAVNNSDQVVGEADGTKNYIQHPFLWQNGKMTDLGTLGGTVSFSRATGINNVGQVTGFTEVGPFKPFTSRPTHPFLYQNGTMYDLGALSPGHDNAKSTGINASGQVVGGSGPNGGAANAFVWTPFQPNGTSGSMVNINPLTGVTSSYANAINNFSSVVGDATDSAGNRFACVWDIGVNGMRDLNTMIPAGSGWVLVYASGINDLEQVVGYGIHNGQGRAFMLTP